MFGHLEHLLKSRTHKILSKSEAVVWCALLIVFFRLELFFLQHTLFTGRWWLSATPQGACVNAKHTHTHWNITILDTHSQQHVPVPLSHHPWPHLTLSSSPATLPAPPSFLCVCMCSALRYMSVWALMCVYWSVSAHMSPSPIWNMAVSAQSVYLDSFLRQETLVAADGRSNTTNSSEKHDSLTRHRQNEKGRHAKVFELCRKVLCPTVTVIKKGK